MQIGTFARHTDQVKNAIPHEPDFIDLRMDFNYSLDFREVTKMLSDSGISCTLHLPSDPCWRPMDIAREIVPFVDIGSEIGAELVTCHTALSTLFYSDREIDEFLESFPLVCDAARERGVKLAVETLGLYYTELSLLLDRCPLIDISLDIGHGQIMALRNRAPGIVQSFYDRIRMANIHDNNGMKMVEEVRQLRNERTVSREEMLVIARRYDEHLCIGGGSIDFEPILRDLKQRSYSGRFLMMCKDPSRFPEERARFMEIWLRA
ncbi:MAG: sugar phosphate isomerase/epimerase family protein [Candidatus Thorarchaeota archaeon]